MALARETPAMAEVDKLLIAVFRRKNWMPPDLIRKVNSKEAGGLGETSSDRWHYHRPAAVVDDPQSP